MTCRSSCGLASWPASTRRPGAADPRGVGTLCALRVHADGALEAKVVDYIALAAQHAAGGGARHRAHGTVNVGRQRNIGARIAPREGTPGRTVVLGQPLDAIPARHQSRHPGAAVAAEPLQVGRHRPAVRAWWAAVVEAPKRGLDPRVTPRVILGTPDFHRRCSLQSLPHLRQGAQLGVAHVEHHPFDDRPASTAGGLSAPCPPPPKTAARLTPHWNHVPGPRLTRC